MVLAMIFKLNQVDTAEANESWHKGRSSFSKGNKQTPSSQNNINVDKIITKKQIIKSTYSKNIKVNERTYKFNSFFLRETNFKNLECKSKTLKAWLHGATIVAYLECQNTTAFIIESFVYIDPYGKKEEASNRAFEFLKSFAVSKGIIKSGQQETINFKV